VISTLRALACAVNTVGIVPVMFRKLSVVLAPPIVSSITVVAVPAVVVVPTVILVNGLVMLTHTPLHTCSVVVVVFQINPPRMTAEHAGLLAVVYLGNPKRPFVVNALEYSC
jgi:hypothetical protein